MANSKSDGAAGSALRGVLRRGIAKFRIVRTSLLTSIRRRTGGADYDRWGTLNNLAKDWDSRTKQISGHIKPGSSVLEFGAGRLALVKFLPPDCKYTPSDLVDRGMGTIVADLN